ncbi:MAG TPA: hypothetical protein VGI69_00925 [Gaiellaceae bacterium]|jgi:hypothetical protein
METSDRTSDGLRRLLVAAATIAALLGLWAGAAAGRGSANGRAAAFRWLQPGSSPRGWKLARLPSGAATFAYPRTWKPVRTDPGTASVALIGRAHSIRGYLNATPRQGTETLANWPSFRIQHLREEESSRDVRLIASAHGLSFRSGRGSCLIDSYRTSRTRYREIACLVTGAHTSTVLVGAAPSRTWTQQAQTVERAIASLSTR